MKTRAAHKKSRKGCLPCKARHVKCDESKPSCVNCKKYASDCEYPTTKETIGTSTSPSPAVLTPSPTEGSNVTKSYDPVLLSSQDTALNISHLRLLHHFTTVTAKSLVAAPKTEEVYSTYMINIALEFPFLLHGILALSALHLSRLDAILRADHLRQAERHFDVALEQFRVSVSDINERNYQAVLFMAAILFPYSCALPLDIQKGPEHMLDHIIQNIALIRRVRPMVTQFYSNMLESEIGRLVPHDVRNFDLDEIPVETELVRLRMFREATRAIYPPDISHAYGEAVDILEKIFARAAKSTDPASDSLIKLWAHLVSPRFMELLTERQPGALIILAHYAVLFWRSQHYWFFEGIAEQILHIADTLVPSEWKAWLDWPKEQIDTRRKDLAAI